MKINLTKKQYRQLMNMCCIADWVTNAYRNNPTEESAQQHELLQYLLSFAKDFEFEENITYVKELDAHRWNENFLENNEAVRAFVAEYDYNRYADMLSDKLAEVALKEKYTEDELAQMDPKDLGEQFMQLKQKVRRQSTLMPQPAE